MPIKYGSSFSITLKLEHKSLVEDGCRLTDKHIGFASSLISHQFPIIGGLRTTLLQTRYYCFPSESIQAIFVDNVSIGLWLPIC